MLELHHAEGALRRNLCGFFVRTIEENTSAHENNEPAELETGDSEDSSEVATDAPNKKSGGLWETISSLWGGKTGDSDNGPESGAAVTQSSKEKAPPTSEQDQEVSLICSHNVALTQSRAESGASLFRRLQHRARFGAASTAMETLCSFARTQESGISLETRRQPTRYAALSVRW